MAEADVEEATLVPLREERIAARGAVSCSEHVLRIHGLRGEMGWDDGEERFAARVRVMGAMRDLVTRMISVRRSRLIGLELSNGAHVAVHPFEEGIVAGHVVDR